MITSTSNQHVAYCRSLQRSKSRREARAFLVEGLRSCEEALESAAKPLLVLFDRQTLQSSERGAAILRRLDGLDGAYDATPHVIQAASATKTPAGIVMVIPEPSPASLSEVVRANPLLILDSIADAGNAGTILRTAAAAGLDFVVFAGHTVDPFSAKTIRSAMGAHFHVRILQSSWADLSKVLPEYDQVVGTSVLSDGTIYDVDWSLRTAVIIGSEAHGLGPSALGAVSQTARVPMAKNVESLNAAAVAAITLFEAKRARERTES